ncbi:MAG: hypothetical protein IJF00_04225 [Bacteroidaceae bacterium]|nr:hypothetical protein [Bacteroidaceae bacterium]MBQ3539731.1 hypothetical protein [Bacteroidaceae bacterium]MBQ6694218.1 hypothetical protein [Bacteroidaceae bacterium]MBR7166294.1 hypothetical protein [Bacteroidaceae bacterium]
MKSIFITFDQSNKDAVLALLDRYNCRGYTFFEQVQGRGSKTGDPHHGSHAWPSMNSAIITIVSDDKVSVLLEKLKELDEEFELLGLRAFVWNIEQCY